MYHIFSDYSLNDVRGAYAYIVLSDFNHELKLYDTYGSITKRYKTHVGEALGSLMALRHIPNGSHIIMHTDQTDLPARLCRIAQLKNKRLTALAQSLNKMQYFKVVFTPKKQRPALYKVCHLMAAYLSNKEKIKPGCYRKIQRVISSNQPDITYHQLEKRNKNAR